jgi:hypothetical protein
MMLHPNAALRVLRREMVRLNDARLELIEALDDPRLPLGVAAQQVSQCDREISELVAAHHWLEARIEAERAPAAA